MRKKIEKRLNEFLESHEMKIDWTNKQNYAVLDQEKKEVRINLFLVLTETLIHEFLHYATDLDDDDKGEKKVERLTDEALDRLTVKQIKRIGRRVMKKSGGAL